MLTNVEVNRKKRRKKIEPVVNIVNPAFQSTKGRGYGGTTELLVFGDSTSAWARLLNPCNSKVCLFLDRFSLTNFSTDPYTAEALVDSIVPGKVFTSTNVSNLNLNFITKLPKAKIQYNPSVMGEPIGGITTAVRRVPANETVTSGELNGKIIIPPGEVFLFFLTSTEPIEAKVAFEWWEGRRIF